MSKLDDLICEILKEGWKFEIGNQPEPYARIWFFVERRAIFFNRSGDKVIESSGWECLASTEETIEDSLAMAIKQIKEIPTSF